MEARSRPSDTGNDELAFLHERLEAHFVGLRDQRGQIGAPIYALEHGLSVPELVLLKERVASSISRGRVPHAFWLPLVVYATEVGYDYSGDEYWQTFESCTPGWVEHGDRLYIRQRFREFKEAFGGAEPSGPWARHFSIICWPITHAVLPADLQRHLARLLFEYRRTLTSELLADPDELGKHLAARSWQASSRFQHFAQNTALLGRVAAALLVGEEERSTYVLDPTLDRIVSDLSEERQARRWLRGAKSTAARVRTRGFRPAADSPCERPATGVQVGLAPAADPYLMLRKEPDGWIAYVGLPDLSVLAQRFPETVEELSHRRVQVAGVAGAPLARSRVLYPDQRLRLSEWPPADGPLLQVEGGTSAINSLLSEQCVLPPGPQWLFRVREPGFASEVRGNHMRPGRDYVLLSQDALPPDLPSWIAETASRTEGVRAYELRVPPVLEGEHLDVLRTIGVGALTDVEIRPAGLVPAMWDGEGQADWLAGEHPVLAVSSTRVATESVWVLDGQPHLIAWPPDERQMFVGFDDLDVGSHQLQVSLTGSDQGEPLAEGAFEIRIRPPYTRPASGTFREGLMILPTPINPSLTELWDDRAVIEVRGPGEIEVGVEVLLKDRSGSVLARRQRVAKLPVAAENWASLFETLLRQDKFVQYVYDDAEVCLICVSHKNLGTVALRCEREFAPLRWAAARDREGPFLRLINNTESVDVQVELFEFERPDCPGALHVDEFSRVRSRSGGLVIARADRARAAMILPPLVRCPEDLQLAPRLFARTKSLQSVLELIRLAEAWATASRPSDPFGENRRIKVLRAITSELARLIGGQRWARLEGRIARDGAGVDRSEMLATIGIASYQQALAQELGCRIEALRRARPDERAHGLAEALARHAWTAGVHREDDRFAEFLLRLASEPASLMRWPGAELQTRLRLTLDSPVLLRAARFMVVAIDALDDTVDSTATYGGWTWE